MNINPINLIPASELGKDSKIKLSVCDTEHDLYWRMAIEVWKPSRKTTKRARIPLWLSLTARLARTAALCTL